MKILVLPNGDAVDAESVLAIYTESAPDGWHAVMEYRSVYGEPVLRFDFATEDEADAFRDRAISRWAEATKERS